MKLRAIYLLLFLMVGIPSILQAAGSSAQEFDAMGTALAEKGFYAQALEYFKAAVQADPYDWQGYQNLGTAYLKLNNPQEANNNFQKSLQINPNNPNLKLMMDNLGQGNAAPVANPLLSTGTPAQPENISQPVLGTPTTSISNSPVSQGQPVPPTPTPVAQASPVQPLAPQAPSPQPVFKPFSGGMCPMSQSRVWFKLEGGYSFSLASDLMDSASIESQMIATNGWSGFSQISNHGVNLGAEAGFLIDQHSGISLGANYLRPSDYNLNQNLRNGTPSDFEKESFESYAVPLSLNYSFFLPDSGGRFFFSGGAAYYFALVQVTDNFNYLISHPGSSDKDQFNGDLTASNIGFQVSAGRDFALNSFLGVSVFVRGRYASIDHLKGTVAKPNNQAGEYALAKFQDGEVHAVDVSLIDGKNITYASLDFTGFDAGIAIGLYP